MLLNNLGEISALMASFCFSIGPTFNTLAGLRLSVATVNRVRILLAFAMLILPHYWMEGTFFPVYVAAENLIYLALSGLFTMVLGDTLLFAAFTNIGTRLAMLVISLEPVFTSLMARFLLDERLTSRQFTGIVISLAGVVWVVLDDRRPAEARLPENYTRGLLLAFGAAFFHSVGSIAAKPGMGGDFPAISAHMVRTFISLLLVMLPMLWERSHGRTLDELRQNPVSMKYLIWGAFFGPLLGAWLSLYAIQNTNVGVASALMALPPVWLLFVGRYFFQEKIGLRAALGSVVAVVGAAVIFL